MHPKFVTKLLFNYCNYCIKYKIIELGVLINKNKMTNLCIYKNVPSCKLNKKIKFVNKFSKISRPLFTSNFKFNFNFII